MHWTNSAESAGLRPGRGPIAESVEAGLGEALSPQDDGLAVDAEFAGHGVVRQPLRTAQNNVRSQDHFLRRIAASNEATKSVSLRSGEG